jgi:hypothetical protein
MAPKHRDLSAILNQAMGAADGGGGAKKKARVGQPALMPNHPQKLSKPLRAASSLSGSDGDGDSHCDDESQGTPELITGMRQMTDIVTQASKATLAAKKKAMETHTKAMRAVQQEAEEEIAQIARVLYENLDKIQSERELNDKKAQGEFGELSQKLARDVGKKIHSCNAAIETIKVQTDKVNGGLADRAHEVKAALLVELEQAFAKHKSDVRAAHAEASLPSDIFEALDNALIAA